MDSEQLDINFGKKVNFFSNHYLLKDLPTISEPKDISDILEKLSYDLELDKNSFIDNIALALSLSPHFRTRFNNRLIYHSYKVGIISKSLVRTLKQRNQRKYSTLDEEVVKLSGFFHDIGHIISPIGIYFKNDELSQDEKSILSNHTQHGEVILTIIGNSDKSISDATVYHHEKINGSGTYGLSKRAIPLIARLIGVVDVYDALRSERAYKPSFPAKDTFDLMYDENQQRLYDSDILRTLKKSHKDFDFYYDPEYYENLWIFNK